MSTYRIVNDDDPMDYEYPQTVTIHDLRESGDMETLAAVVDLRPGESVTVGGGAAVQFSILRID